MQYFKGEGKQKLISQSYRISKNISFFFKLHVLSGINLPCILGSCGIIPLAGSSDVFIPYRPFMHSQRVTAYS